MIRIFLPCTGLGNQQRGFETFTREVAAALRDEPELDISVFKGGGASIDHERTIWNLRRDGDEAISLSSLFNRSPYFIEQCSFFLGFLPHVVLDRPDIIYYADINLGNALWHWRRISGQKYRLLFYNGAAAPREFVRADLVQQVTPDHGSDSVVPHGLTIAECRQRIDANEVRRRLQLPLDRKVVLSVGMIDRTIKRMDYLISELGAIPPPRPFLLILGQRSEESAAIEKKAHELLGDENFDMRTVPRDQMDDNYNAADVFALASLREGFGLVYVEALAHGLPVLAHDYPVTRYILGEEADSLADLSRPGELARLLGRYLNHQTSDDDRRRRHEHVYRRFSWDALREQYVQMFRKCMDLPLKH